MKEFKDFNIKQKAIGFTGEKISINKILNMEIVVEAFKEENSKFEGKGKCLHLQILFNGIPRVVFVGSKNLLESIKQVPASGFPFRTKIIKDDSQRLQFT